MSLILGCGIGLGVAFRAVAVDVPPTAQWDWPVPYGELAFHIDRLSALFLVPTFGLSLLAAAYGQSYFLHHRDDRPVGFTWLLFGVLVASMGALVIARNGMLFLTAWEAMAISSFFLVTAEHERAEVRNAGRTYLILTHIGTACLIGMFALLGREAGTLNFDDFAALGSVAQGTAAAIFLLAMVGFGAKAGFLPLHVWLPEAHPAAPSPVSAVMSGVMVKTGIYGILRVLTFLPAPEVWWGVTLIVVGVASGVMGVLLALMQHDLKRLLAYHTVENIGIIAMGMGVGVLGLAEGLPVVAVLGFSGALLHVVNHAMFKGLLFLCAGSVTGATNERHLDRLGGLLKRMPVTGTAFLIGAVAISGIPPLNGFVSEFLIAFGSLNGVVSADLHVVAAWLVVIAGLGLIGGLAVACFTKAFGVVFLGEPRTTAAAEAREQPPGLWAPMVFLAALCVVAGVGAVGFVQLVLPATADLTGVPLHDVRETFGRWATPLGHVTRVALVVAGVTLGLAVARLWLLRRRKIEQMVTWDCGYEAPSPRMQYTSASFAGPLAAVFARLLPTRERLQRPEGYFPQHAAIATETPDPLTERAYKPATGGIERIGGIVHWLQQGRLHLYLLYIFVTLVILLIWRLGR